MIGLIDSHSSSKQRSMNGAQFHLSSSHTPVEGQGEILAATLRVAWLAERLTCGAAATGFGMG